jgi:hypothetical protein
VGYLSYTFGGSSKAGLWVPGNQRGVNVLIEHTGSQWHVAADPNGDLINSIVAVPGTSDLLAVTYSPIGVVLRYGS